MIFYNQEITGIDNTQQHVHRMIRKYERSFCGNNAGQKVLLTIILKTIRAVKCQVLFRPEETY